MGRTIESATQTWIEEEQALKRFVRALRKNDQELIQELLALSRCHIAEASYASNLYPMDIYLTSMLFELFKKVKRLEVRLEELGAPIEEEPRQGREIPQLPSLVTLVGGELPEEPKTDEKKTAEGIEYVAFQDGA